MDFPDHPASEAGKTAVSVVIPVRNGAQYVGAAIKSALAQSWTTQVIVVDDGSVDATPDAVGAIADRRLEYVRQVQAGAAAARNRGVALAKAPLLAFLDADDLWLDGKLAAEVAAIESGAGDLIFTAVEEFISPDLTDEQAARLKPHHGPMQGVSVQTLLVRRDDFLRVGPFDDTIETGEFLHWYARAQEAGLKPLILPQVLAHRRLHLTNHGRMHGNQRGQYATILHDMLRRRRQAAAR